MKARVVHASTLIDTAGARPAQQLMLSDFLDGWYARRFHQTSAIGAVLDPITDKISALSVMISLIIAGKLHVVSALLLSMRELGELLLIAWLAFNPRAHLTRTRGLGSNALGKVTTAVRFGALIAILLGPQEVSWWFIATVGPLSVVFYVWDQVDLLSFTWPVLALWMDPTPDLVLTSVVIALLLHPLTSWIGYWMGARRTAR